MVKATILFASLVTLVLAKPHARSDMLVHERRDDVPDGFTLNGPAPGNSQLKLRLALVQNDITGLQNTLLDVSTPGSASYGQHLSKEEV